MDVLLLQSLLELFESKHHKNWAHLNEKTERSCKLVVSIDERHKL